MEAVVCTLFEGHYHHGVAALANSLYRQGFRGDIYVGYRGDLPPWASNASRCAVGHWIHAAALQVAEGLTLLFLPLTTKHHLTNYKPDFMLELLQGPAAKCEAIFYFDPDIVVVDSWTYFCDWISCGIAVCEDLNSPVSENHPRRVGWRRFYGYDGAKLNCKSAVYVNAGILGVQSTDAGFLRLWSSFCERMGDVIGGLSVTSIEGGNAYTCQGFAHCFDIADQDALNATIEAYSAQASVLGQEAMGFKPGKALALHAVGAGKPWKRSFLLDGGRGRSPRQVDWEFWRHTDYPIRSFPAYIAMGKAAAIKIASLIGRFYRRR